MHYLGIVGNGGLARTDPINDCESALPRYDFSPSINQERIVPTEWQILSSTEERPLGALIVVAE